MSNRITDSDLEHTIKYINTRYAELIGTELELDYAYGGVRVCINGRSQDLSHRGTKCQAYEWLQAFSTACQLARGD